MGIKQLYIDSLRKLPNEYRDVSVMHTETIFFTSKGSAKNFHSLESAFTGGKMKAFFTFELQHDKTNKMTCAPSEDQPGHPPSLIRVFAVT